MFVQPPATGSVGPRAQMLSGDLARTIEEFRRRYPDTSETDVLQALQLTAAAGAKRSSATSTALLLALALLFGAGMLSLILGRSSIGRSEILVVAGALALIAAVSTVVAITRR